MSTPITRAAEISRRVRRLSAASLRLGKMLWRGYSYASAWTAASPGAALEPSTSNPLHEYFKAHRSGRGIWKWDHYFDVYHRHFSRFRGQEVHVLEIGIYSGGSLDMWRSYFGPKCRVYGVDIQASCRAYESDAVKVFIGDQADRGFWKGVQQQAPRIDIVIDDGGHEPEQQIVTLEEMLPHLSPGGVYLCEDIIGPGNAFAAYVSGLATHLHTHDVTRNYEDDERRSVVATTAFQAAIESVHLYPFVAVIEKRPSPIAEFVAPKRGTEWEPFLR